MLRLIFLSLSSTSSLSLFFFNDTATTEIYTLSLHDALPILIGCTALPCRRSTSSRRGCRAARSNSFCPKRGRSEEHTSELQSHLNLVCRLLLEKKKNTNTTISRSNEAHNTNS